MTGLAVVTYDERRVTIDDIMRIAAQCGYHCRGAVLPRYLVAEDGDPPSMHPPDPPGSDGEAGQAHADGPAARGSPMTGRGGGTPHRR